MLRPIQGQQGRDRGPIGHGAVAGAAHILNRWQDAQPVVERCQQGDGAGGGDGHQPINAAAPGDQHHHAGADVHELAAPFPLAVPALTHLDGQASQKEQPGRYRRRAKKLLGPPGHRHGNARLLKRPVGRCSSGAIS